MLIGKRQAGQPQGVVKLRPDLRFDSFLLPGVGSDLVTGAAVSFSGGVSTGASKKGMAYKRGVGGSVIVTPDSSSLVGTTAGTVVIAGWTTTSNTGGAWGVSGSSGPGRFGGHVPYIDNVVYFDFGGFTTGSTRLIVGSLSFSENDVWVFSSGTRGMEIWQNGLLVGSNSATPSRSAVTQPFGLTSNDVGSSDPGTWYAFGYSRKQMPKEVCEALSRDLWGTAFVQRRRWLISQIAAAARRRIVMWG